MTQFTVLALSMSSTLKNYWRAIKDASKQSRELKQELLLVSDMLEDLKEVLTGTPDGPLANIALKTNLNEFEKVINDMVNRIEVRKGDVEARVKWLFTEKENRTYLSKLEMFKSTVSTANDAFQS